MMHRKRMLLLVMSVLVVGAALGIAPAGATTDPTAGVVGYSAPNCPNYSLHLSSNVCGLPQVRYFQPASCGAAIYCNASGMTRTEVWVYSSRYRKWYPVTSCDRDSGECRHRWWRYSVLCCGSLIGWEYQNLSFQLTRPDLKYWSRTVVWTCPSAYPWSCTDDGSWQWMGTYFYLYCPNRGRPYDRTATVDQHCGT